MTPDETKASIIYANQIDPRVQMNDPTRDLWDRSLGKYSPAEVVAAIGVYYERPYTGFGQRPVIEPPTIRRIIQQETERMAAQQSALQAPERAAIETRAKRERIQRTATPEYQAAKLQGAVDHLADLEGRGIIKPDQQKRLDHCRATGQLKPADDPVFA